MRWPRASKAEAGSSGKERTGQSEANFFFSQHEQKKKSHRTAGNL